MNEPDSRGNWTSASNAEADSKCLGRHAAQLGLPEPPPEDFAESGEVIHAVWTGTQPPREPTPEELDKAEALADQERIVVEAWSHGHKTERTTERRLWIEFQGVTQKLRHSGRYDVRHIDLEDERHLILDGKTGWLDVTPNPSNLQLRDLAALSACDVATLEVAVTILKPYGKTPPPCVYDCHALVRSMEEMEVRVTASNAPNAPRIAGESQCRYCRAKKQCPEFAAAGLLIVLEDKTPIEQVRASLPGCVAAMPGDRLARAWTLAKMLVVVAENELRHRIDMGTDAGGAYLETGNVVRPIENPQEAYQRALEDGMTPASFMGCVSVSKGDLEKALKDVHREHIGKDRLPKGYWEPVWKKFCDGICGEKQNAPSLKWSEKQLPP